MACMHARSGHTLILLGDRQKCEPIKESQKAAPADQLRTHAHTNTTCARTHTHACTGDMLLSAGMIAYLGAFPSELRSQALTAWNKVGFCGESAWAV